MRLPRQGSKSPQAVYLEKAKALSAQEAEHLNQRMRGMFARRREDKNKSAIEIRALQMELEEHQLREWRLRLANIRELAAIAVSRASGLHRVGGQINARTKFVGDSIGQ